MRLLLAEDERALSKALQRFWKEIITQWMQFMTVRAHWTIWKRIIMMG